MSSAFHLKLNHQQARDGLFLTIGVVSPFVLRTLGDWTISWILDKCCKLTKKELAKHLIGRGDSRVTIVNVFDGTLSWHEARTELGLNQCAASLIALIRLLFWHWMQPFLYFYVLFAYWDLLVHIQRILGLIVGGREALYWLMTVFALCRNPVYLLVDLRSTWLNRRNVIFELVSYVIAPDKYVTLAMIKKGGRDYLSFCLVVIFLPLLDLAGVAAFILAFLTDNVYVPLMIGYAVTMIGGIVVVPWVIVVYCKSRLGRRRDRRLWTGDFS